MESRKKDHLRGGISQIHRSKEDTRTDGQVDVVDVEGRVFQFFFLVSHLICWVTLIRTENCQIVS